jgi:hypothetical protein
VRCVLVQEVVTNEVPFHVMCHSVCVTGTSFSDATWDCAVGTATSGHVLEGPIDR